MRHYIEAPFYYCGGEGAVVHPTKETSIFLAGSISGAADWQEQAAKALLPRFHVFNPRRKEYNNLIPSEEERQITWEFEHLRFCDNILFYFSFETVAPITLFEYGKYLVSDKNLFVGCHKDYPRKNDILIQTKLERPDLKVHLSLEDLLENIS